MDKAADNAGKGESMRHFIIDRVASKVPASRVLRVSACGSYVGGTSAFRKNVTCPDCQRVAADMYQKDAYYLSRDPRWSDA